MSCTVKGNGADRSPSEATPGSLRLVVQAPVLRQCETNSQKHPRPQSQTADSPLGSILRRRSRGLSKTCYIETVTLANQEPSKDFDSQWVTRQPCAEVLESLSALLRQGELELPLKPHVQCVAA